VARRTALAAPVDEAAAARFSHRLTPIRTSGVVMKVIHVIPSLDGGRNRLILGLVREQQRAGNEAHVVCPTRPGADAADRLRGLVAELAADVVHTHHAPGLLAAGLALGGPRRPRLG